MPTDKLDQLFGVEEIKAQQQQVIAIIDDTVAHITAASKQMRASELFVTDSNSLAQGTAAIKAATAAVDTHKASLEKLLAVKQQEQTLADAIATVTAQSSKNRKDETDGAAALATAISALNKERERLAAQAAQEATNASNLGASYEQLKKQYKDASDNAKQLAAAQVLAGTATDGFNTKTKDAIGHAQNLGAQLNAAGTQVASYQNKVDACKGVSEQFNSVLVQLPKAAESTNGTLKDLSGYIGSFASTAIKAREEGKSWGESLSAIMDSSEAITASIKLLVAVGGDLLERYQDMKEGTVEAADGTKILTDESKLLNMVTQAAIPQYAKAAAEIDILKKRFFDSTATAKTKKEVMNTLNAEFGKTIGRVNNVNQAEDFFIKRSGDFVTAMKLRAQIQGAYNLIAQNTETLLKQESQTAEENVTIWQKMRIGVQEVFSKDIFKGLDGLKDGYAEEVNWQSIINNAGLANAVENSNYTLGKFIDTTSLQLEALNAKNKFSFSPQLSSGYQDAVSLRRKSKKPSVSLPGAPGADNEHLPENKPHQQRTEHSGVVAPFDALTDADAEALRKSIDDQVKAEEEAKNKIIAIRQELHDKKEALAKDTAEAIIKLAGIEIDAQIKKLDDNKKTLDKNKQQQLDYIDSLNISDQERRDRKYAVEQSIFAQEQELDKRRKQLEREKFYLQQTAALGNVVINTAEAVAKIEAEASVLAATPVTAAYATVALSQIPLVLAGGAIAAATIGAQILAYGEGTTYHPYDGPALIGERWEPEYVKEKGKAGYWIDQPTLVPNLTKGAEVIPLHKMTVSDLASVPLTMPLMPALYNDNRAVVQELQSLKKIIREQPVSSLHIDNGSIRKSVRRGNTTTQYLKRNIID